MGIAKKGNLARTPAERCPMENLILERVWTRTGESDPLVLPAESLTFKVALSVPIVGVSFPIAH
jgi:hypothetical protein